MIPHQYLRVKIFNRGNNIAPIFSTSERDLSLFANLIREYEEASAKREKKGLLIDRIRVIETDCDDPRLVKGICSLLDRRCRFANAVEQQNKLSVGMEVPNLDPKLLRRKLYEESAKRQLALSANKRVEIMQAVASSLRVDHEMLQEMIWNDLEENFQLQSFEGLKPNDLMAWYNLAVVQTLLFSCTNLELSLRGGTNWKLVLRDVKRHGLMYRIRSERSPDPSDAQSDKIICAVDGPLSVLKMTEIYGTALAKLVPSILNSEGWSMQAWIVKRSVALGRKIYDFHLTKNTAPPMRLPFHYSWASNANDSDSVFDSSIEQKFATRFGQCHTDWTLTREPDPIILDDGKVIIPDFLFEQRGQRIYLEIIGYWTRDYLKRKIEKLVQMPLCQGNSISYDIFIAINKEYFTNPTYKDMELELQELRSLLRDHLIIYERGEVPLKQILSYLKLLDKNLVVRLADSFAKEILLEIDNLIEKNDDKGRYSAGIISLSEVAARHNVPIETVHVVLQRKAGNPNLSDSNKYGFHNYLAVGPYLIRKDKVAELQASLFRVKTLGDASLVLDKFKVPQFCHIDLLSELGYDVIWRGIDANNASIKRDNAKLLNSL